MLVLSRRPHQKIVFPALGIKVSVERVAGKVVRLGIDAPEDVRVLREEVACEVLDVTSQRGAMTKEARHALRNRLNTATLGLQVLQRRIESGHTNDLETLVVRTLDELHQLNHQLDKDKQATGSEHGYRQHRALVVEDNANEAKLLAEYLRMSGYEVNVVSNGVHAIGYLRQKENSRPDVVLLDMNMPEMDGPETIASIRSEPSMRGLKLFGVSGANQQELGIETGRRGVDRWFTKPVDAQTLVVEMNRELDRRSVPA